MPKPQPEALDGDQLLHQPMPIDRNWVGRRRWNGYRDRNGHRNWLEHFDVQAELRPPLPLLRPDRRVPQSQSEALDGEELLQQPMPISGGCSWGVARFGLVKLPYRPYRRQLI